MSPSQNDSHGSSFTSPPPHPRQQEEADQVHSASTEAEMAQAFRDLARGEQQATAIEANLTNLESKLDALLAFIEAGSPAIKQDGNKGEK